MKNNIFKVLFVFMALFISNSAVYANQGNEILSFGMKFLQICFGVLISIIVIYIGLVVYKRHSVDKTKMFNPKEQNKLISSKNLDDAIEHFIKDSE